MHLFVEGPGAWFPAFPSKLVTRLDQLASHVPDEDSRIGLFEVLDHVQEMILAQKCRLLFPRVADTSNDAQKVETDGGFVVVQFLNDP